LGGGRPLLNKKRKEKRALTEKNQCRSVHREGGSFLSSGCESKMRRSRGVSLLSPPKKGERSKGRAWQSVQKKAKVTKGSPLRTVSCVWGGGRVGWGRKKKSPRLEEGKSFKRREKRGIVPGKGRGVYFLVVPGKGPEGEFQGKRGKNLKEHFAVRKKGCHGNTADHVEAGPRGVEKCF